jgi:hypothetical protein
MEAETCDYTRAVGPVLAGFCQEDPRRVSQELQGFVAERLNLEESQGCWTCARTRWSQLITCTQAMYDPL